MTADDLARKVAKDLAPEFGKDLPARTDSVISGEQTRGWTNPADWEFALTISSLIVHTAGLAWDVYRETHDLPKVRSLLQAKIEAPKNVSEQDTAAIIDSVVENLKKSES